MKQKLCLTLALGAVLMLASCGKKLGQFSQDYFNVNPNPLEVVGEKVPATITGNIPAKFFVKNAVLVRKLRPHPITSKVPNFGPYDLPDVVLLKTCPSSP